MTLPTSSPFSNLLQSTVTSQPSGSGGGSSPTDPRPGPSSEGGGTPNVSYNINLGLGDLGGLGELGGLAGLEELSALETAVEIVQLLLSLRDNPRVIAGATACYDRLLPWCSSSCGCPKCGCPNGECGCGTFGALLCDCFKACCLPIETDPSTESALFFQELADAFGPIAAALAFEALGIDLTSFLKGETQLDDQTKQNLNAKARENQEHLEEVSKKKHDKKVLEALIKSVEGANQRLVENIRKNMEELKQGVKIPQESPNVSLDIGKDKENILSLPLSSQNIMETLESINVFDLDLQCSGSVGTKDASLMARIILYLLSKWCSSSIEGVRISISEALFQTVLSLVLLMFGYTTGNKEDLTEDLLSKIQDLRTQLPIDKNLLGRLFLALSSTEDLETEETGSGPSTSSGGKGRGKGKGKLEKKPAVDEVDGAALTRPLVKDYGSVAHQKDLMALAQKVCQAGGNLLRGPLPGRPQPPVTKQPRSFGIGGKQQKTAGTPKTEDPQPGTSKDSSGDPRTSSKEESSEDSEKSGVVSSTRF
ncbi:hypothetical protein [Chlamydiifrater phoenicopteri]|uniref:hypothetical protein n=1 Tax=Chlamydiifrater phoenicopteri TaxID=2681469 RepID=UPI001BCE0DF2|nr:hypothetical protein [Chlamydiifrater phoenicopteri]